MGLGLVEEDGGLCGIGEVGVVDDDGDDARHDVRKLSNYRQELVLRRFAGERVVV